MNKAPKVLLLDGDGVIWIDSTPIKGAIDALNRVKKLGIRCVLVTNNCSKTRKQYLNVTKKMGLDCFEEEDIFSSGYATAKYLVHENIKNVFVSGFEGMQEELRNAGITVHNLETDPVPQKVEAVVVSKSEKFTNFEIQRGIYLVKKLGAKLIGTNPDPNFPMPNNILVCGSGAICSAFERGCNKKATVIGKPNKPMFDTVLNELGVTKDEIMMVGDRVITDIAFASRHGARSVLVLTGVDTEEDVKKAPECDKPTYVLPSLVEVADMLEKMVKGQ